MRIDLFQVFFYWVRYLFSFHILCLPGHSRQGNAFQQLFHIMLVFYRENTIAVKKIRIDSAENRVVSLLAQHKMHP